MPRDPWGLDENASVSPPVIGPDYVQGDEDGVEDDEDGVEGDGDVPASTSSAPVSYVPCRSTARGVQDAQLELRYTEDDELALFAYSDQTRLAACCPKQQPWIEVPAHQLDALAERAGAAVILRDERLPA